MTSIEWLVNVVQSCIAPNYIPKEIIYQAKEMHKQEMEISDAEIEKWVASTPYYGHCTPEYKEGLEEGAKWYREQLKYKQSTI